MCIPPAASVDSPYTRPADNTSPCGRNCTANDFDIVVHGEVNQNATWYYSAPKPEAQKVRGYVRFWKGVDVVR